MGWSKEQKREWQREHRRRHRDEMGFSETANYACGGNRAAVLERDGYKCVGCGMTDADHKAEWNRPITVDHKNKNRRDNRLANMQTLCLRCHGRKDLIPRLRARVIETKRDEIMAMRANGLGCRRIARATGFSMVGVWKNIKRWEQESAK